MSNLCYTKGDIFVVSKTAVDNLPVAFVNDLSEGYRYTRFVIGKETKTISNDDILIFLEDIVFKNLEWSINDTTSKFYNLTKNYILYAKIIKLRQLFCLEKIEKEE